MNKESSIYMEVKKEADVKFNSPTGIYKSAWIVREYKKRGGKFISCKKSSNKKSKKSGLKRWFEEEWIRVDGKTGKPMMKNGKRVPCGRSTTEMKKKVKMGLCRPYKRVNKGTPETVGELGSTQMKARVSAKMKNPDKIIGQQNLTKKKKRKTKKNRKINRTLKNKNRNKNRKRIINSNLKNIKKTRKINKIFNQIGGHFESERELIMYLKYYDLKRTYITQLVYIFNKGRVVNNGKHEQFNNEDEAFGEIQKILLENGKIYSYNINKILDATTGDTYHDKQPEYSVSLSAAIDFFLFGRKRDLDNNSKFELIKKFVENNPQTAENRIICEDIKNKQNIGELTKYIIKLSIEHKMEEKDIKDIEIEDMVTYLDVMILKLMEKIYFNKTEILKVKQNIRYHQELTYNNKIIEVLYSHPLFVPIECIIKYFLLIIRDEKETVL